MPLQNRIDPWGKLIAVSARGTWLGNRGILHNQSKEIIAPWRHKSWVTCELQFRGRKREVFGRRTYSELFFLDEATAFSAGHRPCAECRRQRYNEFKRLWLKTNPHLEAVSVAEVDQQLHTDRASRGGEKIKHSCAFESLPEGAFVEVNGIAYLLWDGRLKQWSPEGYVGDALPPKPNDVVTVLTPPSVVELLRNGLVPQVHESIIR